MTCVSVLARSISALFFIAALRKLHVFDCASAKPSEYGHRYYMQAA